MKKEDLRALFKEFDRQAGLEAKEIAEARKSARGILKPEVIERRVRRGQGVVLAYGMAGRVSYGPERLAAFLKALNEFEFNRKNRKGGAGIPASALIRASRPEDIERARKIPSATFFQRRGGLLFFQVTGVEKPHYRVQIRLEEWDAQIAAHGPVLAAAKALTAGRLSVECPCGRHQYWYRYMATLGGYAIAPLERGFPKIRNPNLHGCCCKHVLRALKELKTTRVMFLLARELEREREKKGFSGGRAKRLLANEDIRLSLAKRMTRGAMAALKKFKELAEKIQERQRPRLKVNKKTLASIKSMLEMTKGMGAETLAKVKKNICGMTGLSRRELEAVIKENKL